MATYRITAPDGAEYEVTPPAGTNPSEAEVLAQVQAQAGAPKERGFVQTLKDTVAEGYKAAEPVRTSGQKLLQAIVPTTPTGVGGAAGVAAGSKWLTPLLSKIPQLGRAAAPAARVLGASTLGGVGGAVEGRPFGAGAAEEGIAATGGEALGPVISKIARSVPGAKGRIAAGDAAKYAAEMGRQSPPLAGARTTEDLRRLAAGEGQAALGTAKGNAIADISARVGRLEIPSITPEVRVPGHRTTTATRGTETARVPGHIYAERPRMDPEIQAQPTDVQVRVPGHSTEIPVTRPESVNIEGHGFREPLTLQEANDILSETAKLAFSKNPLDRTFNGVDQRRLYGQIRKEITAALDRADPTGRETAAWEAAQAAYAGGLAFLRPLQKSRAFRTGEELQFNTPMIQKMLADPKAEAAFRNKLGDEGFEALRAQMLRGGKPGEVDVLAPGSGSALDPIKAWARGSNTGFWGLPMALGRTLFPNAGSRYAGRAPYTLSPNLQAILDVVLQRSGGAALDGQR